MTTFNLTLNIVNPTSLTNPKQNAKEVALYLRILAEKFEKHGLECDEKGYVRNDMGNLIGKYNVTPK